jgi:hypothetical protein
MIEKDPPAIHQEAADEMRRSAVVLYAGIKTKQEEALKGAMALGRLLFDIRKASDHGRWLPWLKEAGIPQRTASYYMMACKLPPTVLAKCHSIGDALQARKWLESLCESCYHRYIFKAQKPRKACPECAERRKDKKHLPRRSKEEIEANLLSKALWNSNQFAGWVDQGKEFFLELARQAGYIDPKTEEAKPPPPINGIIRKLEELKAEATKLAKQYRKQAIADLFDEKRAP